MSRFKLVDTVTGEVSEALMAPARHGVGGWARLFQAGLARLVLDHPELHGRTLRVLVYLLGVSQWDNAVPPPGTAAAALGMQRPHGSRAYGQLLRAELLLKRGSTYYMNPSVLWKGTDQQLDAACRHLFAEGTHDAQARTV